LALKMRMQRFGPRKKSRFVREHVNSPTGRAKGYSAVDAAINYLHQRRLFKVMQANSSLAFSAYGEGLLHHRKRNSQGIGLLLDLIDPLKFADRENLLKAVLDYKVNWRDFHLGTDRQGLTFYYPKSEIIATLEVLSDEADAIAVRYDGRELPLMEAYKRSVTSLVGSLSPSTTTFIPFQF